jgi:hypothetical protein
VVVRLKLIKFINRLLFHLALWFWDKKMVKHSDPEFCALIDEFYVTCELWK